MVVDALDDNEIDVEEMEEAEEPDEMGEEEEDTQA